MSDSILPEGAVHVRTTPRFTEDSVPRGLLSRHRVATGTWAVLVVVSGELGFVFDDPRPEEPAGDDRGGEDPRGGEPAGDDRGGVRRRPGDRQVIPPDRVHHLVIDGPVSFEIEFYRAPS